MEPLISLVCTTVGRPDALRRLLTSVAGSERADAIEFVLVDQGSDRSCIEILEYFDLPGLKRSTVSGRGVSAGRNAGTAIATAPIIAFPNDNCWYPPTTIQNVVTLLDARPEWAGISGKQVTADGGASMLRWLDDEVEISRRNFMRTSISSTLFFRRTALPSSAPFDESIGTGSAGWRGAGEESDLLLRILAASHRVQYRPEVHVLKDDDRDAITAEFVGKMLKYGVGMGHLWRRHRLSVPQLVYHSARKLAGSGVRAARGERPLAQADLAYLRGQVAGWRGISPRTP